MITELQEFKVLGDHRGQLAALESNRQIPFDVKRVFYIYDTEEGIPRGNHSHYKTEQFLVAVNGSCKVTLDKAKEKEIFNLNKANLGLFQNALIFFGGVKKTMHDFSSDCVVKVLADEYYNANDYITNYDKFLEVVKI